MQEQQPIHSSRSNRPLWLAVGVLSVAVAALGGTLLGTRLSASPSASTATGLVPLESQTALAPEPAPRDARPSAPSRATPAAPVAQSGPGVRPAVLAACETCGTVVSVTAVQRAGQASGVGAVAGGVVGGVLGNQIGGGSGRAVATVLGAVGGGWAGHETEKRVRQTTRYAVRVRMHDGSIRVLEQDQAVAVGSAVRVQGGVARLSGGAPAAQS